MKKDISALNSSKIINVKKLNLKIKDKFIKNNQDLTQVKSITPRN